MSESPVGRRAWQGVLTEGAIAVWELPAGPTYGTLQLQVERPVKLNDPRNGRLGSHHTFLPLFDLVNAYRPTRLLLRLCKTSAA